MARVVRFKSLVASTSYLSSGSPSFSPCLLSNPPPSRLPKAEPVSRLLFRSLPSSLDLFDPPGRQVDGSTRLETFPGAGSSRMGLRPLKASDGTDGTDGRNGPSFGASSTGVGVGVGVWESLGVGTDHGWADGCSFHGGVNV